MKKIIKLILPICIIILLTSICFVGCSSAVTTDDGIKILQDACVESLKSGTYYTQCTIGKIEYSLNTWPDDAETSDINERVAQFTIADASNILSTSYTYYYYGASLPEGVKSKKASASDYKTFYFEPTAANTYVKSEMTFDDFKSLEIIKPYGLEAIIGTISGITVDNVVVNSIKKTGRVIDYVLNVKEKCNDSENGSYDLSTVDSTKKGVSIRVTNGKISKVSVVTLTSGGNIDENSTPDFIYYISYVGPNLKINDMPHYDVCENA